MKWSPVNKKEIRVSEFVMPLSNNGKNKKKKNSYKNSIDIEREYDPNSKIRITNTAFKKLRQRKISQ